jgi:hypothetical protein
VKNALFNSIEFTHTNFKKPVLGILLHSFQGITMFSISRIGSYNKVNGQYKKAHWQMAYLVFAQTEANASANAKHSRIPMK